MAQIGGVSCTFVRGCLPANKVRNRTWQVSGISGYGAKQLGYGDSRWSLTAEYLGTEADVETWIRAIEALQGTIVSITDDHARTYANCLITRVMQAEKRGCLVGGSLGSKAVIRLEGVRK